LCLVEKSVDVEPVQRLRHGYEIHRAVGQCALLGSGNPVVDPGMRCRRLDLCRAGIGRGDSAEVLRQRLRRLSVAGRTVPGVLSPFAAIRQEFEQCRGIGRAKRRVSIGMTGKVVLECRLIRRRSVECCCRFCCFRRFPWRVAFSA
jgi:hypothetical protein